MINESDIKIWRERNRCDPPSHQIHECAEWPYSAPSPGPAPRGARRRRALDAQPPGLKPSQCPGRAGAHGVLMSALVPDPALLGRAPQVAGHGLLFLGTPAAARAPKQSPPPAAVPAEAGDHTVHLFWGNRGSAGRKYGLRPWNQGRQGSLWEVTPEVLVKGLGEKRGVRKTVWCGLTEGSQTSIVPTGALGCSKTLNGAHARRPTQGQGGWASIHQLPPALTPEASGSPQRGTQLLASGSRGGYVGRGARGHKSTRLRVHHKHITGPPFLRQLLGYLISRETVNLADHRNLVTKKPCGSCPGAGLRSAHRRPASPGLDPSLHHRGLSWAQMCQSLS